MGIHHTGKSDNHDALRQRIKNELVNIERTGMSEKKSSSGRRRNAVLTEKSLFLDTKE